MKAVHQPQDAAPPHHLQAVADPHGRRHEDPEQSRGAQDGPQRLLRRDPAAGQEPRLGLVAVARRPGHPAGEQELRLPGPAPAAAASPAPALAVPAPAGGCVHLVPGRARRGPLPAAALVQRAALAGLRALRARERVRAAAPGGGRRRGAAERAAVRLARRAALPRHRNLVQLLVR